MKVQTNDPNFVRDTNNLSLINKNISELQMLRAQRKLQTEHKQELNDLRSQIKELKSLILSGSGK